MSVWDKEKLETYVKCSDSKSEVLRKIGIKIWPGNFRTLNKYLLIYGIDISHFTRKLSCKGNISKRKIPIESILVKNSFYHGTRLKKRLLETGMLNNICYICGQKAEWNNKKLVLIIDHINGDNKDNRIENLRILCPNCNSQQDTFSTRKNKKIHLCKICGKQLKSNRLTGMCISCLHKEYDKNRNPRKNRIKKEKTKLTCSICNKEITKSSKTGKCFDCSMLCIRKEKRRYSCVLCGKETISKYKNGRCFNCYAKSRRLIPRPSLSVLQSQIDELGYCGTARIYGVSDNAIRKWIKYYKKDSNGSVA